jgi:hypothetical protein
METNKKVKAFTDYLDSVNDDFLKEPETSATITEGESLEMAAMRLNPYSLKESKIHKPIFAFNNGFESGAKWQERKDKAIIDKLKEDNAMLLEALKPLANLDLRGVKGDIVYQRNKTEITTSDVLKAKELLNQFQ